MDCAKYVKQHKKMYINIGKTIKTKKKKINEED